MTTYATGNPVPSTAIKDLYDNAENLDNLVNGPENVYTDRLGHPRKSWRGMENDFTDFLEGSGFETPVLAYVDGVPLQVDRPTQLIERAGILYSIKLPSTFPVILSGTWATDEPLLVIREDQALRQQLADDTDPAEGAAMIGYADPRAPAYLKTVSDIINGDEISLFRFIPANLHADIKARTGGIVVTDNIQDAFDAIKPTGGGIYVPSGVYDIDASTNFWTGPIRGFSLRGDGLRGTTFRWTGTTGHMFTNEQPTPNQFQYGVVFRDMEITARHGAIVEPVTGSVGIHLEMAQNQWVMENLYLAGFDTNIDIGVHSEGGKINKVWTGYAGTGLNLYGDQADGIDLQGVWFVYNKLTGCRVSSPRPTFDTCMFVSLNGFSDPVNYTDMRIGWQAVRPEDIGKTSYLTSDRGNAAIKARIHNCNFEGSNGSQAIIVQNFDSSTTIFDGLSFENNFFALYARPVAIRWITPYNNVSSAFNKIESTDTAASLHAVIPIDQGLMEVNEPFVHRVFNTNAQFWQNGAKKSDFDRLSTIASSALFASPGWTVNNLGTGSGLTLVDLDYDGRNGIKVDYTNITPLAPFSFVDTSCPAGMVHMDFDIEATGNGRINIDARDAASAVIFAKNSIRIGPSGKRRITFGFNNPSTQSITIRIYLLDFVGAGSLTLGEVLFKHGDGSARSFNTKDTATGLRFTTRNNQVFEGAMRVPRQRISDAANFATGHWFTGDQTFSTINNVGGYAAGATSIVVANATGMAVGDYMFFKGATASGRSPIYQSTITTGNKISNIVGNTITLATGIPFNMADGGRVLTTKVFREAASTLL
ncbi:hypothetical protein D3C85_281280 [compost metagenome]